MVVSLIQSFNRLLLVWNGAQSGESIIDDPLMSLRYVLARYLKLSVGLNLLWNSVSPLPWVDDGSS